MPNILSHITWLTQAEITGTKYETYFDSIDNLFQDVTGDGAINATQTRLSVEGGIAPGYSRIGKRTIYPPHPLGFDRKTTFRTKVYFEYDNGGSSDNFISRAVTAPGDKNFGFRFKSDGLYGYCGDGSNWEEVKLINKGPGSWTNTWKLEAILTPGSKVDFWVDDVYRATLSTYPPSGSDSNDFLWDIKVGDGNTVSNILEISELHIYFD